jgi:hypothetical protein
VGVNRLNLDRKANSHGGRVRKLRAVSFILLCTALLVLACNRDAEHTIHITGLVHVYKSSTPPSTYPGTDFIAELGPKDHPAVLETTSRDGYRAAKIRLADGREGWVFSGEAVDIQ